MEVRFLIVLLSCLLVGDMSFGQESSDTVIADTNTTEAPEASENEIGNVNLPDPVIERAGYAHTHVHANPGFKGFWAKKVAWRPRWVKTWQEKKIYMAVWKRMWGPLVVKEWVPVPKPPPGWVKHNVASYIVKNPHYL